MYLMTTLRIHKRTGNFLIIDKSCMQESELSWGAKGLHGYLMGLTDDWKIRVEDLRKRATNGRDAVRSLLNELEGKGYLKKEHIRNEQGKIERLEYVVYETPQLNQLEEEPGTDFQVLDIPRSKKPGTEKPAPGNPTLINNKSNKDLKKIKAAASKGDDNDIPAKPKNAVAAFLKNEKAIEKTTVPMIPSGLNRTSLIDEQLTPHQLLRVEAIVNELNLPLSTQEEIIFCLESPQHFKKCGNEFTRKLNAIRAVIKRGDWETPAEMVQAQKNAKESVLKNLEQSFQISHGEVLLATKMLQASPPQLRDGYESWLQQAQARKAEAQAQIDAFHQSEAS